MSEAIGIFQIITGVATCISVVMLYLSTRANNTRRKKEITIQYTNSHDSKAEELLLYIDKATINGKLDLNKVQADNTLKWKVESYLFSMERLAVGINTRVFDIYLFDRIMGYKTIEHYESLKDYIKYIRQTDYQEKYTEFESMIEKLREIRKKRTPRRTKKPRGNLGLIFS